MRGCRAVCALVDGGYKWCSVIHIGERTKESRDVMIVVLVWMEEKEAVENNGTACVHVSMSPFPLEYARRREIRSIPEGRASAARIAMIKGRTRRLSQWTCAWAVKGRERSPSRDVRGCIEADRSDMGV
jgi:hypothetical protein